MGDWCVTVVIFVSLAVSARPLSVSAPTFTKTGSEAVNVSSVTSYIQLQCQRRKCHETRVCLLDNQGHARCRCQAVDIFNKCYAEWEVGLLLIGIPCGALVAAFLVSVPALMVKRNKHSSGSIELGEIDDTCQSLSSISSDAPNFITLRYSSKRGDSRKRHSSRRSSKSINDPGTRLSHRRSSGSTSHSQARRSSQRSSNSFGDSNKRHSHRRLSRSIGSRRYSHQPVKVTFLPDWARIDTQTKFSITRPHVRRDSRVNSTPDYESSLDLLRPQTNRTIPAAMADDVLAAFPTALTAVRPAPPSATPAAIPATRRSFPSVTPAAIPTISRPTLPFIDSRNATEHEPAFTDFY